MLRVLFSGPTIGNYPLLEQGDDDEQNPAHTNVDAEPAERAADADLAPAALLQHCRQIEVPAGALPLAQGAFAEIPRNNVTPEDGYRLCDAAVKATIWTGILTCAALMLSGAG